MNKEVYCLFQLTSSDRDAGERDRAVDAIIEFLRLIEASANPDLNTKR